MDEEHLLLTKVSCLGRNTELWRKLDKLSRKLHGISLDRYITEHHAEEMTAMSLGIIFNQDLHDLKTRGTPLD